MFPASQRGPHWDPEEHQPPPRTQNEAPDPWLGSGLPRRLLPPALPRAAAHHAQEPGAEGPPPLQPQPQEGRPPLGAQSGHLGCPGRRARGSPWRHGLAGGQRPGSDLEETLAVAVPIPLRRAQSQDHLREGMASAFRGLLVLGVLARAPGGGAESAAQQWGSHDRACGQLARTGEPWPQGPAGQEPSLGGGGVSAPRTQQPSCSHRSLETAAAGGAPTPTAPALQGVRSPQPPHPGVRPAPRPRPAASVLCPASSSAPRPAGSSS